MSKRSIITLTSLAAASLIWANIGFAAPKDDGESRLKRYNSERNSSIEQRDTRSTSKSRANQSSANRNTTSKNNYSTPKSSVKQQRNERQRADSTNRPERLGVEQSRNSNSSANRSTVAEQRNQRQLTDSNNRSERLRVEQARESNSATNRTAAAQQRAREHAKRNTSSINRNNNDRQAEIKRSVNRQSEHQANRNAHLRANEHRQRHADYRDGKRSSNHRPRVVVNQHYHRPGYQIRRLPTGIRRLFHRSFPLYYFGGTYYRPGSSGFVVVSAPIGVRVKSLPVGFATLVLGGISYYHINDVYYRQQGNEYIVVGAPVETASADVSPSVYASGDWVIYPRYGQSDEQLQQDRYECHLWAFERTNYDPSQPYQDNSLRSDYYRAQAACLEGRGYTIN